MPNFWLLWTLDLRFALVAGNGARIWTSKEAAAQFLCSWTWQGRGWWYDRRRGHAWPWHRITRGLTQFCHQPNKTPTWTLPSYAKCELKFMHQFSSIATMLHTLLLSTMLVWTRYVVSPLVSLFLALLLGELVIFFFVDTASHCSVCLSSRSLSLSLWGWSQGFPIHFCVILHFLSCDLFPLSCSQAHMSGSISLPLILDILFYLIDLP